MTETIKAISGADHILQRPSMYLGKRSLQGFQCFINGASFGAMFAKHGTIVAGQSNCPIFGFNWWDFNKWVIETKPNDLKMQRAAELALKMCNQDDEKAFDIYIEWVIEYRELQKTNGN